MPKFSETSKRHLGEAHPDLQKIFNEVIKHFDCRVICGHRGEEAQNRAYRDKLSKLKFPESKHNKVPSLAVDVIPYPVDWDDTDRMRYFAGIVKGMALMMEISIRWGGDWDSDTELNDQKFIDLPHFELV